MRWLATLSSILDVMLLVRLSAGGLKGVYRWFARFLIFDALATVLLVGTMHTIVYTLVLICSRPLYWILWFGVLLEIYSHLLDRHPRARALMQWSLTAGAIAFVLATLVRLTGVRHPATVFDWCLTFLALHRVVVYILALATVLPWLLVACLRVKPPRHLVTHGLLFAALIGVDAGYGLARELFGAGVWTAAIARLILWDLCLVVWIRSAARLPVSGTSPARPRSCTPLRPMEFLPPAR